ncbi:MAG: hypothetical protein O9303_01400 [Silanimonas sp.]|nr:hypothetical protein [Silanimonas sp.]
MDSNTRKPAVTVEVFQAPNGEYHAALCNRRGRVLWQSSPYLSPVEAEARAQLELTSRRIRSFYRAEAFA